MTAVSTDISPKGRGRPRAFDEDEVLDKLVELFWEQGFEASSMSEVVEAAGLNKSSLYNAFGNKEELFFRVLQRYIEGKEAMLAEALGDDGIDTLIGFFEMQRDQLVSSIGSRGCMAVNATTELGLRDPRAVAVGDRYRETLRRGLRAPLANSATAGEIDETLVDAYTESLVGFLMGLSVSARSGATAAELNASLDAMLVLIRSWKI